MRERRPHLFSDSKFGGEPSVTRELLEYYLETLTNRKQETEFEAFCRRLCEREICPNLLPQTGPTGGGDSKVDTETYPVAESLSDLWFEGVGQEASRERWAFAFSAKKDWKAKVKSDVDKIAKTNRGYKVVYFVTNQFVPDRQRAEIEDALTREHGLVVRLLDRTWIVDRVLQNNRIQLVVDVLGMTGVGEQSRRSLGPLDTEREAELERIEREIADPARYRGMQYQLAEDCLLAARLARGLERPRADVEGRFARAERIAERVGHRQQRLRIAYQKAWTALWWYDDYNELNRLYDVVEQFAIGSDQANDIERLVNIWQLLVGAVRQGHLTSEQAQLDARGEKLKQELDRLAAEHNRPNNALQARTLRLFVDLAETAGQAERSALEATLERFHPVLDAAEPLGGYPIEDLFNLIRELGETFADSTAYDKVFERLIEIFEKRISEGEGGRALVQRGYEKLQVGQVKEAVRLFGRAQDKLIKHEYRSDLVVALIGCGVAYEQVGLLWAAWTSFLAAAVQSLSEFVKEGVIVRPALRVLQKLVWLELRLGRPSYLLCWRELADVIAPLLKLEEAEQKKFEEERQAQDIVLGIVFLGLPLAQLGQVNGLAEVLEATNLPHSSVALLYALGHEKALRDEGAIPADETPESVAEFFWSWMSQPARTEISSRCELFGDANVEFRSVVLGCEITCTGPNHPNSIHLMESILGAIEAFLATSLGAGLYPYRQRLNIKLELSDAAQGLPEHRVERLNAELVLQIRHFADFNPATPDERLAFREWLLGIVGQVISMFTVHRDAESHLRQLADEERVFSRTLQFAEVAIGIENVLGEEPKIRISDWTRPVGCPRYPLLRSTPWYHDPKQKESKESKASDLEFGTGEPPKELLQEWDHAGHRDVRIASLIDIPLWDNARWQGTVFLSTQDENVPPLLGLVFKDELAARTIFEGWRRELGQLDADERLRVAILTGIDRKNPHAYKVIIGSNLKAPESAEDGFLLTVSRFNRMEPQTSANLDRFLKAYRHSRRYGLIPAYAKEGSEIPECDFALAIGKTELSVRPAWEIGENDPDSIAIQSDDDPIIPPIVTNAPVIATLKRIRSRASE
jgi:hypothetical protein